MMTFRLLCQDIPAQSHAVPLLSSTMDQCPSAGSSSVLGAGTLQGTNWLFILCAVPAGWTYRHHVKINKRVPILDNIHLERVQDAGPAA